MSLATNRIHIFLILISLLLLATAGKINNSFQFPKVEVSKQNSALNFNDDLMFLFSIGQKRLLSDIFWISTLLESDIEHYQKKDLNSWMYLRFKSIIKLDPKFLNAYRFGGKYLSIIKDDLAGAKEIFDRGLLVYPTDYDLLFDAAYLYAFELQDYKMGKKLYQAASLSPRSPDYIKSLINKLDFANHNDLNISFKLVYKMWEDTPDKTTLKQRLYFDLYSIKAEIDLECLNSSKNENCARVDFYGAPYLYNGEKYYSQTPFKPFRFKNKVSQ